MENVQNRQKSDLGLTGHSNSRLSVAQLGLLERISVSFDRITVVGGFIPERESWVKRHVESNNRIDLRDTGYDRFKCHALDNKVYVEYNRKQAKSMGRSEIRVEFNPNELCEEENQFVQFMFLDNMRDKHFSRIDLAFDVPVNLEDYYVMSDKSVKQTVFYGRNNKPETKYFGVRDSERYIRIYNKKKQLKEVKEEVSEHDHLWRIEFELKRSMTNKWDKCFDDLHILQPDYLSIESFEEQAKIYYLMNEISAWSKIERSTKYRYKKKIKEISEVNLSDDLREVLSIQHKRLSEELLSYTTISHHDKLYDFEL
jgi:hypothetical protein